MTWEEFEAALALAVSKLPARGYLIINDSAQQDLFVQFTGLRPYRNDRGFLAQLAPRRAGDTFTQEAIGRLESLGFFEQPSRYGSLWQRLLVWPAPGHPAEEAARACVLRLRGIGGVASPRALEYTAWRDPWWNENTGVEEPKIPDLEIDCFRALRRVPSDPGERTLTHPSPSLR